MLLRRISRRFESGGVALAKRVLGSGNCFETFESSPSFEISKDDLKTKMRKMQMILHPDRAASEPTDVKELLEEASARCNDSYNEITDDFLRAVALLRHETGRDIFDENRGDEINKIVSPDFIKSVLSIRMEVEDAIEDEDVTSMRQHLDEVSVLYNNMIGNISQAYISRQFDTLEKHILETNYYRKIISRLHEVLPPSKSLFIPLSESIKYMAKPPIGDKGILDRTLQRADRYPSVRSTLNTGNNVLNTRAKEKAEPKDGLRRVKSSALFRMLTDDTVQEKVLVIDVRERENYDENKIIGASHFPPKNLFHAVNPFTPEVFSYKNKPNHMIVAYDLDDGQTVHRAATTLFDRGVDNIFVLSGGLQDFVRDFVFHVEGNPPPPGPEIDSRPVRASGSLCNSSVSGSTRFGASMSRASDKASTVSSHKPKSLSSSISRSSGKSWR